MKKQIFDDEIIYLESVFKQINMINMIGKIDSGAQGL